MESHNSARDEEKTEHEGSGAREDPNSNTVLPVGNETAWVDISKVDSRPCGPEYYYPEAQFDSAEESCSVEKKSSCVGAPSGCVEKAKQYPMRASIIFSTLLGIIALAVCYALAIPHCSTVLGPIFDEPLYHGSTFPKPSKEGYNIVLFGDSLIDGPLTNGNLGAKMAQFLPLWNISVENYGRSGSRINDMRKRLENMLQNTKNTYAIILFWDTDVSDIDESLMTTAQVKRLREAYRQDLNHVLVTIKKAKPDSHLALAGPGLLGEGPLFPLIDFKGEYFTKRRMLDKYVTINKQIGNDHSVPYIDMRQAFLDEIPVNYYGHKGCLTSDGEHPNENGVKIMAKKFSEALLMWFLST